jgi:enamine deaminase RidA (YjgF/YER057c/UK114 family)
MAGGRRSHERKSCDCVLWEWRQGSKISVSDPIRRNAGRLPCRGVRTSCPVIAEAGCAPQRRKETIMPEISIRNPDALGKPLGQYSQITRVKASEFLFIAGQVATDSGGKLVGGDDFDAQCRQVFANIEAALKSQGASFGNVVEFTTYLVHSQDIAKFMAYRLREFPRLFANGAYPPNTLLIVDRLVQEPFLIEVSTIAAL